MITKSLMFQLSIIVVLIASGVLASFGYYRYQLESSLAKDQLNEELTMTTERLAISLHTPLFSFHEEGIRNVILSELKNPDIVGIYIVETGLTEENYWYSKDADGNPVTVKEFPDNDSYINSSLPIIHNSEEIGEVIVFMSTERMDEQLEEEFISIVIQIIILDVLLIVFVIILLRIKVVRPISNLQSVAQKIANGNLSQNIITKGHDEIGELGTAFNQMTAELKDSRKKLEKYNQTLEKKVNKRTKKLVQSNLELKQFAYISSHHLQEPVRSIVSYLQLLEKRYKNKLDHEADEYIGYAVNGALSIKNQVNDILEYHKVSSQKKIVQPVDCELILNQVLTFFKKDINKSGAIITRKQLPIVLGQVEQLQLIFKNLIKNALLYRSEGVPKVHISAKRKSNVWQFSIKDNGIGIEPKYFEQIFEIFQKLHGHDEYPGTGMGLAICKKIIERHNGQIWVKSKPGSGSTFYFTLPTVEGENNG